MRVDGFSLFAEEAEMAFPNRNFQSDRRSICYSAAYTTDRNTILPARELLPPPAPASAPVHHHSQQRRQQATPSRAAAIPGRSDDVRHRRLARTVDPPHSGRARPHCARPATPPALRRHYGRPATVAASITASSPAGMHRPALRFRFAWRVLEDDRWSLLSRVKVKRGE